MATVYARQTVLYNIGGRLDYIGSSQRQENLLGYFDGAAQQLQGDYWKIAARESQQAFDQHGGEHTKKAVEGRELVVKLPNSLLHTHTPEQVCQTLAVSFEQTYHRSAAVALHYNKTKSNLHVHLIYSERELLTQPISKTASRNLFFDEQGKRRYKRGEILNEAGELRPGCRIVSKHEVYEQRFFGSADPKFHFHSWMETAKKKWLLPLLNGPLRGDVEYKLFDYSQGKLPQQHMGKNLQPEQKAAVQKYNELVREYNQAIDEGYIFPDQSQCIQKRVMSSPTRYETLSWEMEILIHPKIAVEMALKTPTRRFRDDMRENTRNEKERPFVEDYGVSEPQVRRSVREELRQIQEKQKERRPVSAEENLAREIFSLSVQYNPEKVISEEMRQQIIKAFARDIKRGNTDYLEEFLEVVQKTGSTDLIEQAARLLLELSHFLRQCYKKEQEYDGMELF